MLKTTFWMSVLGLGMAVSLASAQTAPAPAPAPAAPQPTVNERLENQGDRIKDGVKDDQLTKGEATKLKADDAAVHAEEKVDRKANDGHLTKSEDKTLNKQLNKNSRQIYRARHNSRTPKA